MNKVIAKYRLNKYGILKCLDYNNNVVHYYNCFGDFERERSLIYLKYT